MKSSMKISGLRELEKELAGLKDKPTMRRVGLRAVQKAAEVIRDEAKRLAPDDPETGLGNYLVESIKVGKAGGQAQSRANSGTRVSTFVGIDGSVKPSTPSKRRKTRKGTGKPGGGVAAYSIFTEMGTATHKAKPYMRPAFEAKKGEAAEGMADILRDEIIKTKGRAARRAAK